jgi:hypothetical protein
MYGKQSERRVANLMLRYVSSNLKKQEDRSLAYIPLQYR